MIIYLSMIVCLIHLCNHRTSLVRWIDVLLPSVIPWFSVLFATQVKGSRESSEADIDVTSLAVCDFFCETLCRTRNLRKMAKWKGKLSMKAPVSGGLRIAYEAKWRVGSSDSLKPCESISNLRESVARESSDDEKDDDREKDRGKLIQRSGYNGCGSRVPVAKELSCHWHWSC